MRTTVTLDSDDEQLLRERMAARGISFQKAINDVIREAAQPSGYAFHTPTFDLDVGPDLTKANEVAAELDSAEFAAGRP